MGTGADIQSGNKRSRFYRDAGSMAGLALAFIEPLSGISCEMDRLIHKIDDPIQFGLEIVAAGGGVSGILAECPDNSFVYDQLKNLLLEMGIQGRETQSEGGNMVLNVYIDDLLRIYTYFLEQRDYLIEESDWMNFINNVKLFISAKV